MSRSLQSARADASTPAGITTFQWKSYGKGNQQNYPFNIDYDGRSMVMTTFDAFWQQGQRAQRVTQVWERRVGIQEWAKIVVVIKVSRDPNKGYIELYFNDEKQTFANGAHLWITPDSASIARTSCSSLRQQRAEDR